MTLLFKYTSSRHLEAILGQGTLAFPVARQLNDPFESSIESALSHLKRPPHNIYPSQRMHIVAQIRSGMEDDYDYKKFENNTVHYENSKLKRVTDHIEWCRDNIGVCSLTTDPENVLMWAHYAESGRGVCIGIDFSYQYFPNPSNLPQRLHGHEHVFAARPIKYVPTWPSYNNYNEPEYVMAAYFTKYRVWEYEKEYRLLRPVEGDTTQPQVCTHHFPRNAIREVTLGAACIKADLDKVRELVNDIPGVRIYQIEISTNNYKMDRKPY